MEFTEKYTKKNVKGSTVVEMSYLIPFCLILFFLLITISFYFHAVPGSVPAAVPLQRR